MSREVNRDAFLEDHGPEPPARSVDPVCGMVVEEDRAAGKTGYAGQMYYFCSDACNNEFNSHPDRYAGFTR